LREGGIQEENNQVLFLQMKIVKVIDSCKNPRSVVPMQN